MGVVLLCVLGMGSGGRVRVVAMRGLCLGVLRLYVAVQGHMVIILLIGFTIRRSIQACNRSNFTEICWVFHKAVISRLFGTFFVNFM